MKRLRKIIGVMDRVADVLMLVVFLFVVLIGSYGLYDSYLVYEHANDDSILKYKPENGSIEDDGRISDDMVAWLTIDGTAIDVPVMQGESNSTYLNTDPYGNYSLSGSIFLDTRNSSDFTDDYSLVYGHHMENGEMFGALDDFKNEKFFEEHRTGTVTVSGREYRFTAFAVLDASAMDELLFEPTEHAIGDVMKEMKKVSLIWEDDVVMSGKSVLALSTCKSPSSDYRTMVAGVLE